MESLRLIEVLVPVICLSITTPILFVTLYVNKKYNIENDYSVLAILGIAEAYLAFMSTYVILLHSEAPRDTAMQIIRLQETVLLAYLPILPLFLNRIILDPPKILGSINRYLIAVGGTVGLLIFISAFIYPEAFISVAKPMEFPHTALELGRGEEGILFLIRDVYFGVLLLYILGVSLVLMLRNRKKITNIPSVVGLSLAILFSFLELYRNFTGFYPFFPDFYMQRFEVGQTLFSISVFWGMLAHFIRTVKSNDQLKRNLEEKQNELIYRANYDSQTEMYNRSRFVDDIHKLFPSTFNTGIILIDIEGFHEINEAFGIETGDQILESFAEKIISNSRPEDTYYRIGSDEFAVMVPNISGPDYLSRYVEVLRFHLLEPIKLGKNKYYISSRMGIVQLPKDGANTNKALSNLFSALRESKRRKHFFAFYDMEIKNMTEQRAVVAQDIRKGLNNGEFYIEYQPIYNQDRRIVAAEALIRWRENIRPGDFLPLAESTGLMHELGDLILNTTVSDILKHGDNLPIPIHVNLSPTQFSDADFASLLTGRLSASDIKNDQISFEITESFMIGEESDTLDNINQLKEAGFNIVLDDFGTGHSSLSYLNKLPIDTLKIDRYFVTHIGKTENIHRLIKSIINIAKIFKYHLIAEGVETEEQFKKLKEWGVTHFQGYLLGHPIKINKLVELFKNEE